MHIVICSHDFLILLVHYCFSHGSHRDREGKREREHPTGHHALLRWANPHRMSITSSKTFLRASFYLLSPNGHIQTFVQTWEFHTWRLQHLDLIWGVTGSTRHGWSQCGWTAWGRGKGQKVKAINLFVTVYRILTTNTSKFNLRCSFCATVQRWLWLVLI